MRRVRSEFHDLLANPIPGIVVSPNADLTMRTSMRTHCRAAIHAEVNDPRGLRDLLRRASERDWPLMVLGGGANTLFATSFFEGIVVTLGKSFEGVMPLPGGLVLAGAATPLPFLLSATNRVGLMGLEFLIKVPGHVGGALAGNAGAGNWGLCDFMERALCMTRCGRILEVRRGDFRYGYRHSELKEVIILNAELRLRPLDPEEAERQRNDFLSRKKQQPYDKPSSGCIFKNVTDPATRQRVSTGMLIDQAGLKGYAIRDAVISEGHANFIVNAGEASGEDFQALINFVQDTLYDRYGIEPDLEVNVAGGPMANVRMFA